MDGQEPQTTAPNLFIPPPNLPPATNSTSTSPAPPIQPITRPPSLATISDSSIDLTATDSLSQ
ncbi:hypothetical protein AGABI1DRAFT_99150 [Agaricus bisporus var. burnettii JB137-S8]|uniref:Uncharacterized protein n=1 Tax=Agaricus bisporus var. burnettii (strain JB137-S8 / ATCC MYA-4627 / FGSC 10392) TaxID=597362 RepID=K5XCP5_AGABU|nr:hypothetical protein AGABI2DRAFT_150982 [Agaricus bisporus var. bisporus H97]XP_007328580.1 uncharacterized protein AGABI1DRAFT_99150 [Agaricus bisporus var. burnettii JB137-S8]EKM81063.1 hypothetical protein AGABI1DRAFT_99150 [Agaricus bisporus var. burnettii JB137-S8]EKV47544.1 hypothetical protein AGABI2DRAFT_150982 [Agaricus bisporus var. bisporus H97]